MVEEFQSGREVGLALEALRTSIDGQRDQLILMKWVIGGSSAVAVTIFAYLFAVNTQTTVTTARIESRFDVVDEQFKTVNQRFEDLDQRLDERFKTVNEQFKFVNEQFKVVNEQFKGVNEQFKGVNEQFKGVDERFKAVDQRFDTLQNTMNQRFETMQRTMDQRFDSVDKRLETLTTLITTLLPPKQKTEGFTLAPGLKNALQPILLFSSPDRLDDGREVAAGAAVLDEGAVDVAGVAAERGVGADRCRSLLAETQILQHQRRCETRAVAVIGRACRHGSGHRAIGGESPALAG